MSVLGKHGYGAYNPMYVYTQEYIQVTLEDAIRQNESWIREWELRHNRFGCLYKTKTTHAGRMLELEIYPSFTNRRDYIRAIKEQKTGSAQQKQNTKNAQRKLVRLIQANFVTGDIAFTAGFTDDRQPKDIEECKRIIKNYFSTLKYHSKKAGEKGIKYIYVIEQTANKNVRQKYHVHMIMNRGSGANIHGIDIRDWIESKWRGGDYDNTRRLQWKQDRGGFTGISKYITKQFETLYDTERSGLRHWGQSLGLRQWTKPPTESYSRFGKRKVAGLIKKQAAMKTEFEKEYPGFEYLEDFPCEIRYSDVIDGFYLYCRIYRRE